MLKSLHLHSALGTGWSLVGWDSEPELGYQDTNVGREAGLLLRTVRVGFSLICLSLFEGALSLLLNR